ncbi:GTP-binding protein [Ferrimonas marina]|uniref:GTPase, G3E family n=1 Tax=Ferrimonas marina TaxID=299255 RepID=A0A1M5RGY8_9GAMM|nr:GTP-binding protein [Ferrimonas marina]SHH25406.1 GTPase, G3E family [Ferrimonas marina]
MEAIVAIVGFLGAGKTTLLQHLTKGYIDAGWQPFVILNDYENASLDAQQLTEHLAPQWVQALNGSCICCSGINELREFVNGIPERPKGITLIEANGTSDACRLMGFLGVGIDDRFLPPVQISVVDVKNWQQRGAHNELEASQVQVSSLILLTHLDQALAQRKAEVIGALNELNPQAQILEFDGVDLMALPQLAPSSNNAAAIEHQKAHWASCSTELPSLPDEHCIHELCQRLPNSLLRVKGCTQIGDGSGYRYFERGPDGQVSTRDFYGEPVAGAKLLAVGPGSQPAVLDKAIAAVLLTAADRLSG